MTTLHIINRVYPPAAHLPFFLLPSSHDFGRGRLTIEVTSGYGRIWCCSFLHELTIDKSQPNSTTIPPPPKKVIVEFLFLFRALKQSYSSNNVVFVIFNAIIRDNTPFCGWENVLLLGSHLDGSSRYCVSKCVKGSASIMTNPNHSRLVQTAIGRTWK